MAASEPPWIRETRTAPVPSSRWRGPAARRPASASSSRSTSPACAMASTPCSGMDPCAARPRSRIPYQPNPRWATIASDWLGSEITAPSMRVPSAARARSASSVPRLPNSSSATSASTTSPRVPTRRARSAATIIAARPAFMSKAPRPWRRPSSIRGSRPPRSGSPGGTVSRCPSRRIVRPPPVPRAVARTVGRPGVPSRTRTSKPRARSHAATCAATAVSPAAPGTRSGLVESMRISSAARSTGSTIPATPASGPVTVPVTRAAAGRRQAARTPSRRRRPPGAGRSAAPRPGDRPSRRRRSRAPRPTRGRARSARG